MVYQKFFFLQFLSFFIKMLSNQLDNLLLIMKQSCENLKLASLMKKGKNFLSNYAFAKTQHKR